MFIYTHGEQLDGEWNGSAYPDYGIYTYANGDRCACASKVILRHGVHTCIELFTLA